MIPTTYPKRETLTLDELMRAAAAITATVACEVSIKLWPVGMGNQAFRSGTVVGRISSGSYMSWEQMDALATALRAAGFEPYFSDGNRDEEGYLRVGIGANVSVGPFSTT